MTGSLNVVSQLTLMAIKGRDYCIERRISLKIPEPQSCPKIIERKLLHTSFVSSLDFSRWLKRAVFFISTVSTSTFLSSRDACSVFVDSTTASSLFFSLTPSLRDASNASSRLMICSCSTNTWRDGLRCCSGMKLTGKRGTNIHSVIRNKDFPKCRLWGTGFS